MFDDLAFALADPELPPSGSAFYFVPKSGIFQLTYLAIFGILFAGRYNKQKRGSLMAKEKMTTCKVCGAEIAKNAKACPQCGAKNKKPIYKKWWFYALFIIILLFIALSGGSNEPSKVGEVSTDTESASSAPVQTTFGVGDQVQLNGVVVTFNSLTRSSGDGFWEPEEGNEYILCEFTIENNSSSNIVVSSIMSFAAYADDFSVNESVSAESSVSNLSTLNGDVASGKKMNGIIGYEVPQDWKEFEIRFTPDYWGKEIIFVAANG